MRKPVTPLAVLGLLVLTSCGPNGDLQLTEGWQRTVNQNAAWGIDGSHDFYTDEIIMPEGEGGTDGLSLPSDGEDDDAIPIDIESARETAARDLCEEFIEEPWGDDPYSNQGFIVSRVLAESIWAGVTKEYSGEYIAAARDVDEWVEEEAPDTTGVAFNSPEYEQAQEERKTLYETRWSEVYPHLLDEHQEGEERWQSLRDRAYTSENVLAVQELVQSECDFVVPNDYKHPSADDLGIEVKDD